MYKQPILNAFHFSFFLSFGGRVTKRRVVVGWKKKNSLLCVVLKWVAVHQSMTILQVCRMEMVLMINWPTRSLSRNLVIRTPRKQKSREWPLLTQVIYFFESLWCSFFFNVLILQPFSNCGFFARSTVLRFFTFAPDFENNFWRLQSSSWPRKKWNEYYWRGSKHVLEYGVHRLEDGQNWKRNWCWTRR